MDMGVPKLPPTFTQCDIRGENFSDPEKKVVGRKFVRCLQLRKKFVYWPSTYDRTEIPINVSPVYE